MIMLLPLFSSKAIPRSCSSGGCQCRSLESNGFLALFCFVLTSFRFRDAPRGRHRVRFCDTINDAYRCLGGCVSPEETIGGSAPGGCQAGIADRGEHPPDAVIESNTFLGGAQIRGAQAATRSRSPGGCLTRGRQRLVAFLWGGGASPWGRLWGDVPLYPATGSSYLGGLRVG